MAQATRETNPESSQLVQEKAEVMEINLLVTREEHILLKYKSNVKCWKWQYPTERLAIKQKEERTRNQSLLYQEMNLRYPGRDLQRNDHMHTFVDAIIDAWVVELP